MSFWLPSKHTHETPQPHWSGAAFLVEAMVLVVFVAASLVVLTQVFAESAQRSVESDDLAHAVALASDTAEHFAANPRDAAGEYEGLGLLAVCDTYDESCEGGVLHHAVINVYAQDTGDKSQDFRKKAAGASVYTLNTSVYESEVSARG